MSQIVFDQANGEKTIPVRSNFFFLSFQCVDSIDHGMYCITCSISALTELPLGLIDTVNTANAAITATDDHGNQFSLSLSVWAQEDSGISGFSISPHRFVLSARESRSFSLWQDYISHSHRTTLHSLESIDVETLNTHRDGCIEDIMESLFTRNHSQHLT